MGLALFVIAAVGLLRFSDAYTRLTAVTKSGTLGICLMLLGTLVLDPSIANLITLGLAILLQLMTAPVGGFALSRATFRSGVPLPEVQYNELPKI
nr:monovalent cation/H(+) antiporter subunit G [Nesterenkonia sandarakina]